MTVQEMKHRYKKVLGELNYINKRIEHEQKKEYEIVAIKVSGSSSEFPYLPSSVTVEAEEPENATKSKEKIIKWKKEMEALFGLQRKVEECIDKIEDVETREIVWRYCVGGQTQKQIGEELHLSQSLVNKRLKSLCLKNS